MRTLAFVLLSACAANTAPAVKGGPRGPHADEHHYLARQYDERARLDGRWPHATAANASDAALPWTRSWNVGADDERLAAHDLETGSRLRAGAMQ